MVIVMIALKLNGYGENFLQETTCTEFAIKSNSWFWILKRSLGTEKLEIHRVIESFKGYQLIDDFIWGMKWYRSLFYLTQVEMINCGTSQSIV